VGSCKTQDQLESIGIPNSPNSIALQADYVTVVEDIIGLFLTTVKIDL